MPHQRLSNPTTVRPASRGLSAIVFALIHLAASHGSAAIITNPAMPIDFELNVRLIRATNDNGSNGATVLGDASRRAHIQDQVNLILSQAGVEASFEQAIVPFNNTAARVGSYNTLDGLLSAARSAGVLSNDPKTANVIFVDAMPGGPLLNQFSPPQGNSADGASGVAFHVGADWLDPFYETDQDNIAVVLAHELFHNIGALPHTSDPQNIMRPLLSQQIVGGQIVDYARLTTSQAARVRSNPAGMLVPQSGLVSADFNGDGAVNLLDLDRLGSNFGLTSASMAQGDANGDGVVDLLDLDLLGVEFDVVGSNSAIPEPTSAVPMLLGLGLASRHRRRNT